MGMTNFAPNNTGALRIKMAAGGTLHAAHRIIGVGHVRKNAPVIFCIACACLGDADYPRGPGQQTHAKVRFQLIDRARDCRW